MIEYISEYLWQMWAVVAVVCLILELMAGDFFIICFSIGGLFAAFAAAVGFGFYWQLGLFALCSLVALFWVRPVAKRYLHKGEDVRVSNADALIGRRGRVVESIEKEGFGRVQIDGDVWKAYSTDGQPVEEGETVEVISRESTIIEIAVKS